MIHIDELNGGILLPQILPITLHIACLRNVSTSVLLYSQISKTPTLGNSNLALTQTKINFPCIFAGTHYATGILPSIT